ncbi:MAG: metal-binding protein [candidate division Zixibacteria bacterium HGW-Zixibacteria-1]|nr:MAG: metal-binding protein [candidate division Zixibacteria bacterium HGW-Zixibacteria-1]
MAKIAIIGCKRIQDQLCVACEKCLKAMSLKDGEFSRYQDNIELVALGNCGDCPGLIMPKLTLIKEMAGLLERDFDTIHLGTCIVKAKKTGKCPLDFEQLATMVKENFDKDLVVGTHNY